MSNEESRDDRDQASSSLTPHGSTTYKVLGELSASDGVGVLGHNTAGSGTAIGVQGATDSPNGYGLHTPDDAQVEGSLDTTGDFTVNVDGNRALQLGADSGDDAGNVIIGNASNVVDSSAVGATISGGGGLNQNRVYDNYGTVGGGEANWVGTDDDDSTSAEHATIGGGRWNEAKAFAATVGGGNYNKANESNATVAGGVFNVALGLRAAVGGGNTNEASGGESVVGGGGYNTANAFLSTIGGGGYTDSNNRASTSNVVFDEYGTIAGGGNNQAGTDDNDQTSAKFATVGGGNTNEATDTAASVLGGESNGARKSYAAVGGGFSNGADGYASAIPGGFGNTASGQYSFAAGRSAKATTDGSFVWSDSGSTNFSSTNPNQFLVDAAGGVGVGTESPTNPLHVVQNTNPTAGGDITGYTVRIDHNTNTAEGLAISTNSTDTDLTFDDDFIGFFDGSSPPSAVGSIEGNGSGGIELNSGSADYAEYMPLRDPEEDVEVADVVGVVDGAVTRHTEGAEQAMVVSGQAIVTGNSPGIDPEDREGHEVCAFVGQVPVKVRGPVDEGDFVVPSGEHDGTGRAIVPTAFRPGDGPIVGRAWESDDTVDVSEVTVAVGLETGEAFQTTIADQANRIDELEAEAEAKADRTDDLEAENEALRERLGDVEARLASLEADPSPTATADD